jgi:formiminotetrahydrofolate cyclodeaminase
MPEHEFRSASVAAFLDGVASDAPTPGGGAAAAVAGATGAALVGMLARLTVGRPAYEAHEKLLAAVAEQADEERQTLLELAEKDAAAYDAVTVAYGLPQDTTEQRTMRQEAVQAALRGACEIPLAIMERCLEVIGLARNAVTRGYRNAASDGAVGAELARAALKSASYNVRANLASIEDADYVKASTTRLDEMLYMGINAANTVDSHVQDLWGAEPSVAPEP